MKSRRSFLSLLGIGAAAPFVGYECAKAFPASGHGVAGLRAPFGHLIVVGHDMVNDKPNDHAIYWNDPATGEWEPTIHNSAGAWLSPYALTGPAAIVEGGVINIPTAYGTWEMGFVDHPFIYAFHFKSVTKQQMEIAA